ncbi:plasmid mobilization protein [Mucilaginibacter defluvii]|uniref:Mobilization protein MobC n=1 Tax=Mucilaginibacter defluvii TaxID=1196019 RepID=A0ABP9FL63_9SPHI
MEKQQDFRKKWLHIRLTDSEHDTISKNFRKTTCRKLSDYARHVLLGKPVIATYRDKSLDDLMAEAILLRKELNNIGNNFNQAVKRLHTIDKSDDALKLIRSWEQGKTLVENKVAEIKDYIEKIASQWLQ